MTDLEYFLDKCSALRIKTTNCNNSQEAFANARSVTEAIGAFRMFWLSVVDQVPADLTTTLLDLYPRFRTEMHACGVYFNEPPSDIANSIVFVGGIDEAPEVEITRGRVRVSVISKAKLTIGDHIRCTCYAPDATVICRDRSRLTLHGGTAYAYDRSTVSGNGTIHTYHCATARVYGGHLYDHGHQLIQSYNHAIIHSCADKKIVLNDNSQLVTP